MQSTFLKAIKCQPVDHIPVWFMRQAGRYMQEFRTLREKYTFMELIRTPELAAEVTMQPIRTFGFDAAIQFCDILVMADAFDLGFTYVDKQGPVIGRKLKCSEDLLNISLDSVQERLQYVFEGIRCTKHQLKPHQTPLIGFAGAPFTIAQYLVGEEFKKDEKKTVAWCLTHGDFMHEVLELITQATILYLKGQVQAGVDALQIFESWNSALSWTTSKELSAYYIKKIIHAVKAEYDIPIALFGTANSNFYSQHLDSGMDVISFDAKIDLSKAREQIPKHIALQGNLDAHFLLGPKAALVNEVDRILNSMQGENGFIFNLGHGILPETPEENVRLVVDRIHSHKASKGDFS